MAGNYPDVPGLRMAYDLDGSTGFYYNVGNPSGTIVILTNTQLKAVNDESMTTAINTDGANAANLQSRHGLIFPETRDLVGMFFVGDGACATPATSWAKSTDTTNGIDGTWTTFTGPTENTATNPQYRTLISTISGVTAVKAVRWERVNNNVRPWYTWHIYGNLTTGQTPNRLRMWHPTLDQEITGAHFDFAEIQRSATSVKQFRVKNNSSSLTANAPALSLEYLTDASPTMVGQFQLSSDGSTYANTLTLGNVAPGAISPITYLRAAPSSTAQLSLWSGRVKVVAASWS